LCEPSGRDPSARKDELSSKLTSEREICINLFEKWSEQDQIDFVECLLKRMCHYQHGHINTVLKPMLQRDFISLLPSKLICPSSSQRLLRIHFCLDTRLILILIFCCDKYVCFLPSGEKNHFTDLIILSRGLIGGHSIAPKTTSANAASASP